MNLPSKMTGPGALGKAQETAPQRSAIQATEASVGAGAAFRALLERLERSAKELDEASSSLEDPRELGDAVKSARVSVEEAVIAGGDLLEAYRAAKARAESTTPSNQPKSTESTSSKGQGGQR